MKFRWFRTYWKYSIFRIYYMKNKRNDHYYFIMQKVLDNEVTSWWNAGILSVTGVIFIGNFPQTPWWTLTVRHRLLLHAASLETFIDSPLLQNGWWSIIWCHNQTKGQKMRLWATQCAVTHGFLTNLTDLQRSEWIIYLQMNETQDAIL